MHRYVHRLLDGRAPSFSYSTDGAEMGKLMVAEGLGATVLPDFSVIGDPLEQVRRDHLPAARGGRDRGAAGHPAPAPGSVPRAAAGSARGFWTARPRGQSRGVSASGVS